jgi:hypothetical protein
MAAAGNDDLARALRLAGAIAALGFARDIRPDRILGRAS